MSDARPAGRGMSDALVRWVLDEERGGWTVRAGFTARAGGVSAGSYASLNLGFHVGDDPEAVAENRRRLARALGTEPVFMNQVHGTRIQSAAAVRRGGADGVLAENGDAADTDGLLLDLEEAPEGIAAAVMVADCVPLILVSREAPRGLVVHVGRRGLLGGIAPKAVERLGGALGAESVSAFIGPAIAGEDYEVPESMREEAVSRIPEAGTLTRWGTPGIDVPSGLEAQLRGVGVRDIRRDMRSTYRDSDLFSYRRDHATGRFAGVLALLPHDTPRPARH